MDTSTLRLSRALLRGLRRDLRRAEALSDAGLEAGEALSRLAADARLIEA